MSGVVSAFVMLVAEVDCALDIEMEPIVVELEILKKITIVRRSAKKIFLVNNRF